MDREDIIAEMESKHRFDTMSKHFGRYLLFNRRNMLEKEEVSWCKWVLNFIEKVNINKLLLGMIGVGKGSILVEDMILFII